MNEEIRKAFDKWVRKKAELYADWDDYANTMNERFYVGTAYEAGYLAAEATSKEALARAEAAHKAEVSGFLDFIEKQIKEIEGDERYHYPPAPIQVNAPLALIQVEMKAKMDLLKQLKALAHYKQVPCKECGGSETIYIGRNNIEIKCPHCTNGHVWERREDR